MLADHIKISSTFTHTLNYKCETKDCGGIVVLSTISDNTREQLYGANAWPCHCNRCGGLYISNCKLPLEINDNGSVHRFNLSLAAAQRKMLVIRLNTNRLD